jgi:hypothetical protein
MSRPERARTLERISVNKRRIVAVVVSAIAIVGAGGLAAAAWQSTGAGSAAVQAATAHASTITAVSAVDLYPGATKTALVSINNPNPYPVVVTSVSAGTSSAQSGTLGTCSAAAVTTDALAPATGAAGILQSDGTTMTIAASASGTFQLTTHMVANADNACQAQTFTLPLTATLASNA